MLLDAPGCCGQHVTVHFLPQVNPDGFELSLQYRGWRGNGNHVDLNRNFGVDGEGYGASDDQSSQNFRGVAPESEAETKAVSELLAKGGYSLVLDMHSAAAKVIAYLPALPSNGMASAPKAIREHIQLDLQMGSVLSQVLGLQGEILRKPCGALQCAAVEREGIVSYIVETPQPRRLPLAYTKFDFEPVEARELASRMCEFLVQCETIWSENED